MKQGRIKKNALLKRRLGNLQIRADILFMQEFYAFHCISRPYIFDCDGSRGSRFPQRKKFYRFYFTPSSDNVRHFYRELLVLQPTLQRYSKLRDDKVVLVDCNKYKKKSQFLTLIQTQELSPISVQIPACSFFNEAEQELLIFFNLLYFCAWSIRRSIDLNMIFNYVQQFFH